MAETSKLDARRAGSQRVGFETEGNEENEGD
jgi:hypothetical protein